MHFILNNVNIVNLCFANRLRTYVTSYMAQKAPVASFEKKSLKRLFFVFENSIKFPQSSIKLHLTAFWECSGKHKKPKVTLLRAEKSFSHRDKMHLAY